MDEYREKVRKAIADYDRGHPPEDPTDRRRRELAEAREAEERAKQAQRARPGNWRSSSK